MNKVQLRNRTRQYLNETSGGGIWKDSDINAFMDEAIDRLSHIPHLIDMDYLDGDDDVPAYLPKRYHYLISVYASARCFEQDDSHYKATEKMNEFEVKMEELQNGINDGSIVIRDPDGNVVDIDEELYADYVRDVYHNVGVKDEDVAVM